MKNINKKRILYYLETYSTGGIEKVVNIYYDYFSKFYDVDVLCGENLTNRNIKHLLCKKYNHYIRTYKSFKLFDNYLNNNKYDIIHIHVYNGIGLKYAYIASKYCKNVIVQAHNNDFRNNILGIKSIINKYYIRKYSSNYKYITTSSSSSLFCFGKKAKLIPNSFNYDDFKYNESIRTKLRKQYNISNDSLVLGNVGRLTSEKNILFLIEVFNKYHNTNPNSYLVLIGEGNLKKKINKMSIPNLIMLDYKSNINEYYNMFDLYLAPSLFEGFGRTIVEAQINGLYTLVSPNISSEVMISKKIRKIKLNINEWISNIKHYERTRKCSYKYTNKKVICELLELYKKC